MKKTESINLKNVATMVACFAVFIMLAFTGCKKEEDKKTDGGGGTKLTGIEFEKTEVAVEVGKSVTLRLLPVPSKATLPKCTFSSDNDDVATVNNAGKVTAKSAGVAYITAETSDGKFSADCEVTVTTSGGGGGGGDDLTGIKFDKAEIEIKVGSTSNLTLKPVPSTATLPSCTYSSEDDGIATVNSTGKVTAVAVGETVITAETNDGKFSTECTVKVTDNGGGGGGDDLTGIKFDKSVIEIKVGATSNLTLKPIPSTATLPSCTYSSEDDGIATVNSTGKVTAVAVGETVISAETNDGRFSAECTVKVTDNGGGGEGGNLTYKDPYLKFGDNQDAVKNYETRVKNDEGEDEGWYFIEYKGENADVKKLYYWFDEDNKLQEVDIELNSTPNMETRAKEFLSKKYTYKGLNEYGEHSFLSSDEKMEVCLFEYEGSWYIWYGENSSKKSGTIHKRKSFPGPIKK